MDPSESGHPYAYAENNPVRFTDPSGLCIWKLPCPKRARTPVRLVVSVIPFVGDINDAIAVATGYDIIWDEHISREERALYAAGLIFGSGSMWRKGPGFAADAGRAGLKAMTGIGYADCFVAACAQLLDSTVVTGDLDFRQTEGEVAVEWLPEAKSR